MTISKDSDGTHVIMNEDIVEPKQEDAMSNSDKRDALNRRVTELGNNADLKTKGEHQSRMKCSQCGKSYLGQKNSSTCGDACRQAKSRA